MVGTPGTARTWDPHVRIRTPDTIKPKISPSRSLNSEFKLRGSAGRVGGDADHELAEVFPFQQTDERFRRVGKTVDDILAELDPAGHHVRSDLLHEGAGAVVVIADDEPLDKRPLHEQRPEVRARRIPGRVVLR